MKTVEIADATSPLADYVEGVRAEPLVITDHGTPTAVILPLTDVDLESIALGTNPEFIALIERSRSHAPRRRRVVGGRDAPPRPRHALRPRIHRPRLDPPRTVRRTPGPDGGVSGPAVSDGPPAGPDEGTGSGGARVDLSYVDPRVPRRSWCGRGRAVAPNKWI